jgi:hypothetical protein
MQAASCCSGGEYGTLIFVNVLLALLVCGLALSAQGFPEVKDWNSVSVKLERTGNVTISESGASESPGYSVEILGTGEIRYSGLRGVTVQGEHTDRVSREELEALLDQFRAADFLELELKSRPDTKGATSSTLTLQIDGIRKSVSSSPEVISPQVTELESAVDFYGHTTQWVFGDPRTVAALRREDFDFRSADAGAMVARAAYQADAEAVRQLIAAGVPLEVEWPYICGAPLVCAVHNHNREVLRMLIAARASQSDPAAKTAALGAAIRRDERESERLLREYGARGFPDVKDWSSVKIRLEKSSCLGSCPAYSLEINANGEVSYEGHYAVGAIGSRKSSISQQELRQLVVRFESADFFACAPGMTLGLANDAHNITLAVSVDGATAKVAWYKEGQVPKRVMELEAEVDRVANTAQWVNRR